MATHTDRAWASRTRERLTAAGIVALLLACSAFFLPRWADWNQNSRLDQVMAIVDQGVLHIDDYYHNTGDYALFEGHYYSDKAPGVAFLGVPVYAAMRALVPPALVERLSARLATNTAVLGTLRPEGSGLLADKVYAALALYVLAVVTVGLPSALAAAAIYRLSGEIVHRPTVRVELALAYGLATIAFPYAQAFMGHQLAAACAIGALALAAQAKTVQMLARRAAPIGLLLGYGLITEYPVLFVLAPVGVYALCRLRANVRGAALLVGAAALPVLAAALYNWTIYHTPLPVAYRYSELFPHHFGHGLMGFTRPTAESLWGLTFSPYRGLFFTAPLLLMALPGAVAWARARAMRPELAVAVAGPALLLLFISGMATWAGGNAIGPRHLATAIPFLMLLVGAAVERGGDAAHAAFRTLTVISAGSVWLLTISGQAHPPETATTPLLDYALPHFLAGDIARNLGTALHLPGRQSLIPVLALIVGGYAWLRRLQRPPKAARPRAESRPTYGSWA